MIIISYLSTPYLTWPSYLDIYHTLPKHTIPYLVISYHTLRCHFISYLTLWYLISLYLTSYWSYTLPLHTVPHLTFYIDTYHTLFKHTIPYLVISHHIPYPMIPYLTSHYLVVIMYLTLTNLVLPYLDIYHTLPKHTLPHLVITPYLTCSYLSAWCIVFRRRRGSPLCTWLFVLDTWKRSSSSSNLPPSTSFAVMPFRSQGWEDEPNNPIPIRKVSPEVRLGRVKSDLISKTGSDLYRKWSVFVCKVR